MTNLHLLYQRINELDSLKPSKRANRLFSQLVTYSLSISSKDGLTSQEISTLQKICSKSEYELEKYWSEKLINSKDANKALLKFPYLNNYFKLTKLEWYSLLGCSKHDDHKVIFIGGGPLPLTAIVLAQVFGIKVSVIEKEKEAVLLARAVLKKLHLCDKIEIIETDALEFDNYQNFNVFFVAALAGLDEKTKTLILAKIKKDTARGSHILARSSWGGRELLYKPIDTRVFERFKPLVEVRPHNDIVNSIVIFET